MTEQRDVTPLPIEGRESPFEFRRLPPHDHTIEPGEINRRGCERCAIEAERAAQGLDKDGWPKQWSDPTYLGDGP